MRSSWPSFERSSSACTWWICSHELPNGFSVAFSVAFHLINGNVVFHVHLVAYHLNIST